MTPDQVHFGRVDAVHAARQVALVRSGGRTCPRDDSEGPQSTTMQPLNHAGVPPERGHSLRCNCKSGFDLSDPNAQSTLIVALANWYAQRAQNVVSGDGVEMEVRQRERQDEAL